jgi:solute carrier family 66 (lysosomal lysine-arginine transporter), member 1
VLGCYFVCADTILISQCLYYNARSKLVRAERDNHRRHDRRRRSSSSSAGSDTISEESPLLRRSSSIGLPGSHRHLGHHEESELEPLRKMITGEDETQDSRPWLHNSLSILAVCVVGVVGWLVSYRYGMWDAGPGPDVPEGKANTLYWLGTSLGYLSAVFYLCARLPQIYKNWKDKSCDGLALLFFLLSLTGNSTYGLSLLAYSQKKGDLIKAIPWLVGSLGTIVEDMIIFIQFRLYRRE